MKKIILMLCIILLSTSLFAQEEVIRKDGRTIIIYNNGTWKYKPNTLAVSKKEASFPNIKSFFNFFKQAVADNNYEELYKYIDPSKELSKSSFLKYNKFSNRVKKIIMNTSLPEYNEPTSRYFISGNDAEEWEPMLFSIYFEKGKNGNWIWDMNYVP